MNTYLHSVITYFENALHPATGKNTTQKLKRRTSKSNYQSQTSPDSLNIRASVSKPENARRNPAP